MTQWSIPVDLFNPGQVFACLGFIEAARVLGVATTATFDWSDRANVLFRLDASAPEDPFARVLRFLAHARVSALVPEGSSLQAKSGKWQIDDRQARCPDDPFPQRPPESPAALPAVLSDGTREVVVDAWGDTTKRDNVKFWAGAGGYPGTALVRDALDAVRDRVETAREDPFSLSAPQTSSLRFDWRRDYVPLGIGFSLNEHGKIRPLGYPIVEVLAAVGLTHARPQRPDRSSKLEYRYGVLGGSTLPATLHRAALGCAPLPFPRRTFRMKLEWPGQEDQARCITSVSEEPRQ